MPNEFIGGWAETWRAIWLPFFDEPLGEGEKGVPEDIFCELYRELAKALKTQPSINDLGRHQRPSRRHTANALRAVDMRDMVALSILLAGFTPYLSHVLNPDVVYRGA